MTLQQAYEIQRRELTSLRAENARLKKQLSGLFPHEEKESLERHIRRLERTIKEKDSRYASASTHWKIVDNRCFDLQLENLDLKDQVASLQDEIESLRLRVEVAEKRACAFDGTGKNLVDNIKHK